MNPEYVPQPLYGVPSSQAGPTNASQLSPNLQFQSVPLTSKTSQLPNTPQKGSTDFKTILPENQIIGQNLGSLNVNKIPLQNNYPSVGNGPQLSPINTSNRSNLPPMMTQNMSPAAFTMDNSRALAVSTSNIPSTTSIVSPNTMLPPHINSGTSNFALPQFSHQHLNNIPTSSVPHLGGPEQFTSSGGPRMIGERKRELYSTSNQPPYVKPNAPQISTSFMSSPNSSYFSENLNQNKHSNFQNGSASPSATSNYNGSNYVSPHLSSPIYNQSLTQGAGQFDLNSAFQNLNISQRQYPKPPPTEGSIKNIVNGDSVPSQTPPTSFVQQSNQNSQQFNGQLRGTLPPPPGFGYPPMHPSPVTGQPHPMMSGVGQPLLRPQTSMSSMPGMPGQSPLQPPVQQSPLPRQPPMTGQSSPMGGSGIGYPQPIYQQPEQNKRLDPDQMPSPIQVTQDDQRNRSGLFCTNQKGLVPPLVTTNFIVQDQGNTSPRFIRSTMYSIPITQDIMKQTAVPFSLAISPMARTVDGEYQPPIVNFGELGPIRCIRCKAYMCPFMQFIDSGRRFYCLFCKATTDVPNEYFQHLDHTGQRMDRFERPELILGTYELIATSDYCRNNILPKPPAFIFIIDVSYNNIKSGLVNLLCLKMKDIIKNLPIDNGQDKSNMRIGFITYNSSVHFYNIKGTLASPQMLIVGDVNEMFMPLLDGFLCTPDESMNVIDSLMKQIPIMFNNTRETETILLPAILAGLEALKASDTTGKLLVFHSTLPIADAPGKLKNRDDRKLLNTDKERTILTPQIQAYNQLGQDCVSAGCSVDLFIFNNAYIDIATIGQVSRLTGGEIFKYTYFQADIDGERLINDIIIDISRPIGFDGVMRVRTSTGVRPTDFYGNFYMSNTTDIELGSIDCDKSISVEIKHDDKLSEDDSVYIQAALLYTSCSGQRRLRIMNLSLKTCSQMADLYRSCDSDTIINYIAKQSIYKLLDNNPKTIKDNIVNRGAQMLATYRKNCASPSSAGQLILPECMKLLPLYINCLLKSDALSGGSDMTIDDRSFVMFTVMTMDIPTSVNYFYPRLIPIHNIDLNNEKIIIPSSIRCTIDKITDSGVYLLENGIHLFLWISLGVNEDFIKNLFGVSSIMQIEIDKSYLPELDNPISITIRKIIDDIRIQRHRHMRLTIVRQKEKLEPIFKHFLAEDRGNDGSASYVDFLIHMHKEIRALLS